VQYTIRYALPVIFEIAGPWRTSLIKCIVILGRWRNLCLVLVEIKRGVELRLAREQFLKPWEVVYIALG